MPFYKKIDIDQIDPQKLEPKLHQLLSPLKKQCKSIGINKFTLTINKKSYSHITELSISLYGYQNSNFVAEFTISISKYDDETTACIEKIELDPEFRNKGLSTIAINLFNIIFKSCQVDEITIVGIDDGRFVWAKKRFNMSFCEPETMRNEFYKWSKNQKKERKYIGLKPYFYPKAFLKSKSSIKFVRSLEKEV